MQSKTIRHHPLWQMAVGVACTVSAIIIPNHLVFSASSARLDFILDWGVTLVFSIDAWLRYRNLRPDSTQPTAVRTLAIGFDIVAASHGPYLLESHCWIYCDFASLFEFQKYSKKDQSYLPFSIYPCIVFLFIGLYYGYIG